MLVDPKHLRMVMQNIFIERSEIHSRRREDHIFDFPRGQKEHTFESSDTGYGIPKHQQDKIFTKLFRADNVRDKDTNGTGLGLYIVKSIVENSGGKFGSSHPARREIKDCFLCYASFGRDKKICKK